jgi:putative Holliday junction resolvase
MRWLGIDHGTKRTGIAICDENETLAGPLCTLATNGSLCDNIAEIVRSESVAGVVVGLPLNMDNSEGPQAKKVRQFAHELNEKISIEIIFFDERLSSYDAEQKLVGLDLTRKKKKKHIDAIAAAAILQAFLDTRK